MKKIFNWKIFLGLGLILLSAVLYFLHFKMFHDAHHIFIYLLGDIAFVPIEVLMVTLIIHNLLEKRAKKSLIKKLNMLIGVFFSNAGTDIIIYLSGFDSSFDELKQRLDIDSDWDEKEFKNVSKYLRQYNYKISSKKSDLPQLGILLNTQKEFFLNLLANSSLLEHESFTKLLWAITHLAEELSNRKDFLSLPDSDYDHLSGDIERAYRALINEWVNYMEHLKEYYPYLFSLAMRTNPFKEESSVVIYS